MTTSTGTWADDSTGFWEAARYQRCCAVTGRAEDWDAHHVIYAQHVKKLGFAHWLWHPDNALRITKVVHGRHHNRKEPIPISKLTDENFDFARKVLGDRAAAYLRRYYHDDGDPRLETL